MGSRFFCGASENMRHENALESLPMSLNLTGLADVAERSLQQITEIADDRRQTLDGAKHHAHVDVRLNELEESALSSLLMPMCARSRALPAPSPHKLGNFGKEFWFCAWHAWHRGVVDSRLLNIFFF